MYLSRKSLFKIKLLLYKRLQTAAHQHRHTPSLCNAVWCCVSVAHHRATDTQHHTIYRKEKSSFRSLNKTKTETKTRTKTPHDSSHRSSLDHRKPLQPEDMCLYQWGHVSLSMRTCALINEDMCLYQWGHVSLSMRTCVFINEDMCPYQWGHVSLSMRTCVLINEDMSSSMRTCALINEDMCLYQWGHVSLSMRTCVLINEDMLELDSDTPPGRHSLEENSGRLLRYIY